MPRNVLIIHPGSLGDVLLSLPALRRLRAVYPAHACGLMVGGAVGRLLEACGEIDRLFPLEQAGLSSLLGGGALPAALQAWLAETDLVVGWMEDAEAALTGRLQRLGVERLLVRSPFSIEDPAAVHQTDRYFAAARLVRESPDEEPLRLPQAVLREARTRMQVAGMGEKTAVLLHPGSGSLHKCSPPHLFQRVSEWLSTRGLVPALVGGPADDERLGAVAERCADPPRIFRGLDLLSMAGLLSQAALYLGHDSGLTHLAARLEVPTLAIFGPTDPRRWAPRGRHVQILTAAPCACKDWPAVQACRDKPCLQLSEADVIAACRRQLLVPVKDSA